MNWQRGQSLCSPTSECRRLCSRSVSSMGPTSSSMAAIALRLSPGGAASRLALGAFLAGSPWRDEPPANGWAGRLRFFGGVSVAASRRSHGYTGSGLSTRFLEGMVTGDALIGVNTGLGAGRALALSFANGREGPLHFFGEISATAPRPQGYVGSAGRALVWSLANGRERPLTFFLGVIGESAAASHGCKGSTVQIGGMATEGAAKDTKAARSQ